MPFRVDGEVSFALMRVWFEMERFEYELYGIKEQRVVAKRRGKVRDLAEMYRASCILKR